VFTATHCCNTLLQSTTLNYCKHGCNTLLQPTTLNYTTSTDSNNIRTLIRNTKGISKVFTATVCCSTLLQPTTLNYTTLHYTTTTDTINIHTTVRNKKGTSKCVYCNTLLQHTTASHYNTLPQPQRLTFTRRFATHTHKQKNAIMWHPPAQAHNHTTYTHLRTKKEIYIQIYMYIYVYVRVRVCVYIHILV